MLIRSAIRSPLRAALRSPFVRGAGAFSPMSLYAAGQQGAWYDFSDPSAMFQDSAGTTLVSATGQPIGKVIDKSGNSNHIIQATTSARPTWNQDGSGFLRALLDGIDDCWASAVGFALNNSDKVLVVAGLVKTLSASGSFLCELGPNAANIANPGTFGIDTNGYVSNGDWIGAAATGSGVVAVDDADTTAGTFPVNAGKVVSVMFDLAQPTLATEILIRINGAQQGFGTTGGTGGATGNFSATQTLNVGTRATGLRLQGSIYQLIIRGGPSTAAEIAAAERFVGSKMGIAL